jgi:hypothetical protein
MSLLTLDSNGQPIAAAEVPRPTFAGGVSIVPRSGMFSQFAAIDREAIWTALFAWFQASLGGTFTSMGRRHVAPPKLKMADQPALFLVSLRETQIPQKPPGAPPKLILHGLVIVYAFNEAPVEDIGQEKLLGETILNGLLLAIDSVFVPDDPNTGKFTLGGLVTHCWIEGNTEVDPGIFGNQLGAMIPVHILID